MNNLLIAWILGSVSIFYWVYEAMHNGWPDKTKMKIGIANAIAAVCVFWAFYFFFRALIL